MFHLLTVLHICHVLFLLLTVPTYMLCLVPLVDCTYVGSTASFKDLGKICTGELRQPKSSCFGRGLAITSFELVTVSLERDLHKPNSRTEHGHSSCSMCALHKPRPAARVHSTNLVLQHVCTPQTSSCSTCALHKPRPAACVHSTNLVLQHVCTPQTSSCSMCALHKPRPAACVHSTNSTEQGHSSCRMRRLYSIEDHMS